MQLNKSPRRFLGVGFAFIAIGLAEMAVKTNGVHNLMAVGIAFLAIGIAFIARSRRAPGV